MKRILASLLLVFSLAGGALADTNVKGLLYSGTFTSGATVTTQRYRSCPAAQIATVFVNATQAGNVQVFRVDGAGVGHAQSSNIAVTGNVEQIDVYPYPLEQFYVVYVNTNASGGTLRVDVDDGCPRQGG